MFTATFNWEDDRKSILIMEVRADEWKWETTYAAMQELKARSESVDHSIYTVIIFNDTPPTPGTDVFRNIRKMTTLHPKNTKLTVFVGTNSLFRAIFNTVNKIYLLKNMFDGFRFVATKEQALAVIEYEKSREKEKLANQG